MAEPYSQPTEQRLSNAHSRVPTSRPACHAAMSNSRQATRRQPLKSTCTDSRLVIELDGGQHLGDPVADRRDRRKDQLLQENGYFVLRFLAEDVGKDLDAVLDAIRRVLARRRQSAARVEPLKFVRRGCE